MEKVFFHPFDFWLEVHISSFRVQMHLVALVNVLLYLQDGGFCCCYCWKEGTIEHESHLSLNLRLQNNVSLTEHIEILGPIQLCRKVNRTPVAQIKRITGLVFRLAFAF